MWENACNYEALQVICSKEALSSLVIQCVSLNMSVWTFVIRLLTRQVEISFHLPKL